MKIKSRAQEDAATSSMMIYLWLTLLVASIVLTFSLTRGLIHGGWWVVDSVVLVTLGGLFMWITR